MSILFWKTMHLIFMVTWFAALFYLPRLFVYHAISDDQISKERFKVMERKLYYGIAWPGGVITSLSGLSMIYLNHSYLNLSWLRLKLLLVAMTWFYHLICGYYLKKFLKDSNVRSHVFYRFFNELPVITLISIIYLAIYRPYYSWV